MRPYAVKPPRPGPSGVNFEDDTPLFVFVAFQIVVRAKFVKMSYGRNSAAFVVCCMRRLPADVHLPGSSETVADVDIVHFTFTVPVTSCGVVRFAPTGS